MRPELFWYTLQAENFGNYVSELHSKKLRFWTYKLWKCAQNFFCKPCKWRTSKICMNFTTNNFIFERINCENAPRTIFINLARRKLLSCIWTLQQTALFLDANFLKMCSELFVCKPSKCRTSKMHLNFTTNSFVCWHINRKNASRTIFVNLARRKLPNASELHSKHFRFWTHKSWKCAQNFFCKPCKQRTSKMRLNFTLNIFVFGRINRENAPRTFSVNLASGELPKCVWTS